MRARELGRKSVVVGDRVALVAVGVPLLEDMIGDHRWFVVRNMVGILGEIRSADAVDHFARTLLHDSSSPSLSVSTSPFTLVATHQNLSLPPTLSRSLTSSLPLWLT